MKTREQLNTDILLSILSTNNLSNVVALYAARDSMRRSERDELIESMQLQAKRYETLNNESVELDESEGAVKC